VIKMNPINFLKSRPITLIGIIVLIVGFSPAVLAIVNIDTTPPTITYCYPWPVEENMNCPLTPDADGNFELYVDIISGYPVPGDVASVNCVITAPSGTTDSVQLTYNAGSWGKDYHYFYPCSKFTQSGYYYFKFTATDANGNSSTMTGKGGKGAPEGKFYINDIYVSQDASITLNTRTLSFKFVATKDASEITNVWINIQGRPGEGPSLSKQPDGVTWNGGTWTAPADGTYVVKGYYMSEYGESFLGLSLVSGVNEPPLPPTPWTTFDYLKILGVALIVIGLFLKR